MKILLSAGHGKADSGSRGADGKWERVRNLELANDLRNYLVKNYNCSVDVKQEKNLLNRWAIKNRTGYGFALSIHFNAFNGQATGTECLHKGKKALADRLSKKVADAIGINNRGAKSRSNLYMLNIGFDALIEICFHDNRSDLNAFNGNRSKLIENLGLEIATINKLKHKQAKYNLTRILRNGSVGNDVKRLQSELNTRGFKDARGRLLVTDGIFGTNTDFAVGRFQHNNKLIRDGIVGKNTAHKLGWLYKGR